MRKSYVLKLISALLALLIAGGAFVFAACGREESPPQIEAPLTGSEVIARYRNNVVELIGISAGSGIILYHDEGSATVHILTCLHIICEPGEGAAWRLDDTLLNIDIRFGGEAVFLEYAASAVGFYRPYDMVVLSVAYDKDKTSVNAISIDPSLSGGAGLRLGEGLYMLGSPENNGVVALSGIVSIEETAESLSKDGTALPLFGVSMPVFAGYSGGLIADASGKLVGMAAGKLTSKTGEIIIGYALPFTMLYALYTRMAAAPSAYEYKTVSAKVEVSALDGLTLTVPLISGAIRLKVGRDAYTVLSGVSDITVGKKIYSIGGRAVKEGLFAVLETLADFSPNDNGENVIVHFNDSPCAVF